jgi:ABC-type transport system involved in cytochrome bd biosynthesis fused ATPase/permease subunit
MMSLQYDTVRTLADGTNSFGNGSILLWMLEFFLFIIWFWLLIAIVSDLFRDHEASGWSKVIWTILLIVLPFIGILLYLLVRGRGMAHRSAEHNQAMQQQVDAQIRAAAGTNASAPEQISQAKALLDSGAITQAEFDSMKAKALAS